MDAIADCVAVFLRLRGASLSDPGGAAAGGEGVSRRPREGIGGRLIRPYQNPLDGLLSFQTAFKQFGHGNRRRGVGDADVVFFDGAKLVDDFLQRSEMQSDLLHLTRRLAVLSGGHRSEF